MLAALLICAALPLRDAGAGDWRLTPRVTAEETYSDNINLAPSGGERADFVTEVSPAIGLHGSGRRLKLDFDYILQGLLYARGTADPGVNHKLQAIGNAELWKNVFFIDARSTISQQNVSNSGRVTNNNLSVTNNRTDVITWEVSPYVRHRFGSYADTELRYTRDQVINSGVQGNDSTSNRIRTSIRSGKRFQRMTWSLVGSREKIDNESGRNSEFQRVAAETRYHFSRKYSLILNGGIEKNDFATSRSSQDGPFWQVGLSWTPSPRTSIDAGFGKRFFGKNYFFDLSHRSRRTVWSASYNEDTSTVRQVQLERQLIPLVDAFGEPILVPGTDTQILIPVDTATLTNEVLIRKRFNADVAVKGRRTKANFGVFHERRDFQLTGDEETVFGLTAGADRRLSRHTSLKLSGRWQTTDLRSGNTQTFWRTTVGLTREFARDVSGALRYSHERQTSDLARDEYAENRVTASVRVSF